VRTSSPVFNQGITQGDTLKGSDWDAWVMPRDICDTHPTLVTTSIQLSHNRFPVDGALVVARSQNPRRWNIPQSVLSFCWATHCSNCLKSCSEILDFCWHAAHFGLLMLRELPNPLKILYQPFPKLQGIGGRQTGRSKFIRPKMSCSCNKMKVGVGKSHHL
jgi:hypothetical protein